MRVIMNGYRMSNCVNGSLSITPAICQCEDFEKKIKDRSL